MHEIRYCNSYIACENPASYFIGQVLGKGATFVCEECVHTWRNTYYDSKIRPISEYEDELAIAKAEWELSGGRMYQSEEYKRYQRMLGKYVV